MRVCFVLPNLRPSGGVAVAVRYAKALRTAHGVDAELVLTSRSAESVEGVPVRQLTAARDRRYDIAVGTWWETVAPMLSLPAARRCILLQSFEQRFYDSDMPFERISAEAVLASGVHFLVVASWLRDTLAAIRPDARVSVVRPGVDKLIFGAAREPRGGPLEVLVEGQPTLKFKGVQDALAALADAREPIRSTLVSLEPESARGLPVDRVVGGLDPGEMAALYRESDVLLKLSRVEGLGLAPVEGFHSGLPCVVTPYTGHSEYAIHDQNALIVGFDDVPGTAATLDSLARDRSLLRKLSDGAFAAANAWPSEEDSAAELHFALQGILADDPAPPDEQLLHRTLALNTELGRARFARRGVATEHALTAAERLVRELSASRDECGRMLDDTRAQLARVQASPPYRLGQAVKRAVRRVGRR